MISLIQLTDNDKRLIICLLLIFILAFVIAGFVGILVKKIMRFQARKADDLLYNVVVAGVCKTPLKLRIYGYRKNIRTFFKQSWIPMTILLVGAAIYFISSAFYGHMINLHQYEDGLGTMQGGEGWTTIFFVWDLKNPYHGKFFGLNLISGFPLLNKPHFVWKALPSIIFFFSMLVGGVWWFVCVQAYISRAFRIYKISKDVFHKSLEGVTGNDLENNLEQDHQREIMKDSESPQTSSNNNLDE